MSGALELRCALDPVAFVRAAGMEPAPWQREFLEKGPKDSLVVAARQAGKTTGTAALVLHQALFTPESRCVIVAPAERQAKLCFAEVARFYIAFGGQPKRISSSYKQAAGQDESLRKFGLSLPNGSTIDALPGSERTIRGFSGIDILVIDEAARIDDELFGAVTPMLAKSGGKMVMLTTPYGKRGVFYKQWTEGIGWERYEVPWWKLPEDWYRPSTKEFLAKERLRMTEREYRREYECTFEEPEGQLIPDAHIERAVVDDNELPVEGFGWEDFEVGGNELAEGEEPSSEEVPAEVTNPYRGLGREELEELRADCERRLASAAAEEDAWASWEQASPTFR